MNSASGFTDEEIRESFWGYQQARLFPESAIEADIGKQNYAVFPRPIYVDIEKHCRQCGRAFLFFAREQQYWYEVLKFCIDADCVKCVDCRRQEQHVKRLMQDYERLLGREHRSREETRQLKHAALELLQMGYIRNTARIDGIG